MYVSLRLSVAYPKTRAIARELGRKETKKEHAQPLFLSLSLSTEELAAMNISARESLRLAGLVTSNDLSVRRADPTKDGRSATIGDTAALASRARVSLLGY